jgi:hypothetical protein
MELFKPLDTQVRQAPDSHPVDFCLSKTRLGALSFPLACLSPVEPPIYKISLEEARSGAVFPGSEWSIPMFDHYSRTFKPSDKNT